MAGRLWLKAAAVCGRGAVLESLPAMRQPAQLWRGRSKHSEDGIAESWERAPLLLSH